MMYVMTYVIMLFVVIYIYHVILCIYIFRYLLHIIDYTIICTHSENMRSYNGDQLDVTKNIIWMCLKWRIDPLLVEGK